MAIMKEKLACDEAACTSTECPLRENCFRFIHRHDNKRQWFVESPFVLDEFGKATCHLYWPIKEETK